MFCCELAFAVLGGFVAEELLFDLARWAYRRMRHARRDT